ncbi:MAG: hypothetical protein ACF8LL_14015 [Phycisphaerales bacterium]
MSRPRHPKPEIEKAVQYAEQLGWTVRMASGHAWGRLYCPLSSREGCIISVWSTPRSPSNHARHIRNAVDRCPHRGAESGPGDDE